MTNCNISRLNIEINRDKFDHRLKRIVTELTNARGYMGVWEQLWPTTDEIARVENRYRSFFGFTRMALNQQLFLSLAKLVEKRRRKNQNLSIWSLLTVIENEPTLLSRALDLDCLKRTLIKRQELLERIIKYRDKEIAHIDDKYFLDVVLNKEDNKRVKILFGEVITLQKGLEDIVNKISVAYNGTHLRYETLGHDDTAWLLKDTIKWLYKE